MGMKTAIRDEIDLKEVDTDDILSIRINRFSMGEPDAQIQVKGRTEPVFSALPWKKLFGNSEPSKTPVKDAMKSLLSQSGSGYAPKPPPPGQAWGDLDSLNEEWRRAVEMMASIIIECMAQKQTTRIGSTCFAGGVSGWGFSANLDLFFRNRINIKDGRGREYTIPARIHYERSGP